LLIEDDGSADRLQAPPRGPGQPNGVYAGGAAAYPTTGITSMDNYLQISSPEVFFVADSHFRDRHLPGEPEKRERFIRFLDTIPDGSALLLLGDIFDFYFEYASVVTNRFFDIFFALHTCRSRNIDMHFLGGNHDYWVGAFLTNDLGIRIHDDDFMIEVQGRKIRCAHGDFVIPDDGGYRKLRAVLRNPAVIKAARLIHPDLMSAIARRVSGESKKRRHRSQQQMANHLADIAGENFYAWGNDAFVMGHVHYPLHRVHDERDFVIVGDWIDHFSYAKLCGGKLSIERSKT
jgi:UDP-2,3-diacylglucosamine hydrolase